MFQGIISALITPFKDNRLDREALKKLLEYQISEGIHGVVPCGTTGESATLSHDEHKEVIEAVIEIVDGRVPVIAGTGSNSTHESIEMTRFAKQAGADGALLIAPYYNKPTQEGLYRHYIVVAETVDIPIVLYNVPGRTAIDMTADTVARLAEIPNIVAIKEATSDMERASRIHATCGEKMGLISGDDATFLPFLAIGGQAEISVTANVAPALCVAVWDHWKRGETEQALVAHETLLTLHGLMFCESNPMPVKAAANMLGFCGSEVRMPLLPLSDSLREPLRQSMVELGLFDKVKAYL